MKINGNTIKCWASLKEQVERLNMALPPQNGAAINPHRMVAAIVITTVVIHITFITVTFVFTVLILLPSFPLKRERCLNGYRQEDSQALVGHGKTCTRGMETEASLGGGAPGWHPEDTDEGRLEPWQDLAEQKKRKKLGQNAQEMFRDKGQEKVWATVFPPQLSGRSANPAGAGIPYSSLPER